MSVIGLAACVMYCAMHTPANAWRGLGLPIRKRSCAPRCIGCMMPVSPLPGSRCCFAFFFFFFGLRRGFACFISVAEDLQNSRYDARD